MHGDPPLAQPRGAGLAPRRRVASYGAGTSMA
jgi:hypothetical protein